MARMSDKTKSMILSGLLHAGLTLFIVLMPVLSEYPSLIANEQNVTSKEKQRSTESGAMRPPASTESLSGLEKPLPWSTPNFSQAELGAEITIEPGRPLKTHSKRPPSLSPPEFIPYLPPALEKLVIDPDLDVLKRSRPADYDRDRLTHEQQLFHRALVADLQDCRLDRISLEEALLRLRYFRLQDQLLLQGEMPDFSYAEVQQRLREKMAGIDSELKEVPPENWATALLLAYRKDKIYEEKRGHSLFNSIWYDIYNCRSGTEELLIYFTRYHPELELATVRGSILKFDGTVMGHMDPAVKIDGKWMVFKTVSLDTVLVEEYKTGELYKLEKIIADYLPELANGNCNLDSPLARNGEPLADNYAPYDKSDHPLVVKDRISPTLLWRESSPYAGPFRMMAREDRMQYGMLARYPRLTDERQLLNENDPFADLLFHFFMTPPAERQALLDLYLQKRITTYPEKFKRPLRTAAYIPSYEDLLTTLNNGATGKLEIAPGKLVPLRQFSGHDEYLSMNGKRMAELTRPPAAPEKKRLPAEIRNYLFTSPEQGISAIFPPQIDSRQLVSDLLDDRYDLSISADEELLRRANGSSARAIAILKAGLSDQRQPARQQRELRIALLKSVLAHTPVDFAGSENRARNELPAALSFAETVSEGGKRGLSPGFIKDMVELMGEEDALHAFDIYLQPALQAPSGKDPAALQLGRLETAEMLGYFDSYLLQQKNKDKIIRTARQLHQRSPGPAIQAGAAQFLVTKTALEPAQAEKYYLAYLELQPFDVQEIRSLLTTGLPIQQARKLLHARITQSPLQGLARRPDHPPGNKRLSEALLQLDELMRGALVLGDNSAQKRIASLLTNLLRQVFEAEAPPYAAGLNALTALVRSASPADPGTFSSFLLFGARDPAGYLYARPMSLWLGKEHYLQLIASHLKQEQRRFNSTLQDLARLRSQAGLPGTGGNIAGNEEWFANYQATLDSLVAGVASISFLNGLSFQDGQVDDAQQRQTLMLAELFKQPELQKDFAPAYSRVAAVRDESLFVESMFRALEIAGHFARIGGQSGQLEINHAPTIILSGKLHSQCGTMARVIDARNAPRNPLFTKAGVYLDSLFDAENSPEAAAEALHEEQKLVALLARESLSAETRQDLEETVAFFRNLDKSDYCDIKRLYLLEKLLRRAVLPQKLPTWVLQLARDSYRHEMKYLNRIKTAGGINSIFRDYRSLSRQQFNDRWGEHPFSIRNLYGTLLLIKMGHLQLNSSGEFEATDKF